MKIYSMTATFGKLEHQTLTLEPGLNVIHAPNEWGKSTWCAFLVNMLYGLDTKTRTTKTELADKERYAPWSGAPMAGRIDLNWKGRDITIERQTQGRLLLGGFSAYESATGLPVEELNAANCGQELLGVERSVFTRAGFLRLSDLPVTQDDALRRRLNNLVTTGDESGAGDKLGSTLRDLKNKCRFNNKGKLPAAEAERKTLENQLGELNALRQDTVKLRQQLAQREQLLSQLENHRAALQYEAAKEDTLRVAQAEQAYRDALAVQEGLQARCEGHPVHARESLETGLELQQQLSRLQAQPVPPLPEAPAVPEHYRDVDALQMAQADLSAQQALEAGRKKWNRQLGLLYSLSVLIGGGAATAGAVLTLPILIVAGGTFLALAAMTLLAVSAGKTRKFRRNTELLCSRHPGLSPDRWLADAQAHADTQAAYAQALAEAQALREDWDSRNQTLQAALREYAGEAPLDTVLDHWRQILGDQDALSIARRDCEQAQKHAEALRAMLKPAVAPRQPDSLTYPAGETDALIASTAFELRQLQIKIAQYEGRCEALGQEESLRAQLKAVTRRIHLLEDTYSALELAMAALSTATTELQRRFAPRISKQAQSLFSRLTGQRYDRLTLSSDLSLNTCTREEDTLRPAQHRSDGTVDQLYLALRLAVAQELTPEAPLVLDDALVRFDDTRLKAAMDILRELGQHKQVILFTCQEREKNLL